MEKSRIEILGSLINPMILVDDRVVFLPFDSMRPFRSPREIEDEINKAIEKVLGAHK